MKINNVSRKMRGFTLIELLVVIAIIGILASIVLISIGSARKKATNTRIQAEITQMRTQLEQNYTNAAYSDLVGSVGHNADLSLSGPGVPSLTILLCDIGALNGFVTTVTGDITLTCGGVPSQRSGVVVYSTQTGSSVSNYGVYATTSPGGYVCIDSYGNSNSTATGSIPAYAAITSTSTALCQ